MEQLQTDEKLAKILWKRFELNVTANDIRKCNQDMVQKMYMHCLVEMGASLEQIKEVPFGTCEKVQQYPDMYRTVMHTMGLAKVIQYFLFNIFGDETFMPADLYDPKPKKTRHYLWMMIDYINQYESSTILNEVEEQVHIKREKRQEMEEKIKMLKEKLHQHKLENAEQKIQLVEEEKRIAEDKQKLEECQARKNHLKNLMESKKILSYSLSTAIKEAEIQVIQGGERAQKLRAQVVLDSERVEIDERENHLAHLRTWLQEKKEHLDQLQHNLAMMEQTKETYATMRATMQDILQEWNKKRKALATVDQLKQDISASHEQMEDKDMQIQQLKQQIESEQVKISQMHQTWKMKSESFLEDIKQHKLTLEQCRRNKNENEIAFQDMKNEHIRITSEISQLKEQIIHIDNFISSCYQRILQAVESNQETLQSTLADTQQSLENYKE